MKISDGAYVAKQKSLLFKFHKMLLTMYKCTFSGIFRYPHVNIGFMSDKCNGIKK